MVYLAKDPWSEMTMAKMKAVDAAVLVLEQEGVSVAFGVPGAASEAQ